MKAAQCWCLGAFIALLAFISSSAASGLIPDKLPARSPELIDMQAEMAPIAFFRFCMFNKEQCEKRLGQDKLVMTGDLWSTLNRVNAEINSRIVPDAGKGAFDWSTTTTVGNCNDYAVQKQKALLALGLPMPSLSLTVAETPQGLGHLVVTVRTDRGDFVLDNLRSTIVAWNRTGYLWLKRQSVSDPRLWVSIAQDSPALVAAGAGLPPQNPKRFSSLSRTRRVVSDLSPRQLSLSLFGVTLNSGSLSFAPIA